MLFLALVFVGALTISATTGEEIIGKWYVQSMEMSGQTEEFDDESMAPWMEFQSDNLLLLGESDRKPQESKWRISEEEENIIYLDSFGEEIGFTVIELNETTLTLQAVGPDESLVTLALKRHL